jgi:tRNA 2-selenouridine synthase
MIQVSIFLQNRTTFPLLDVRSPSEFAQGHIPGARSFPLFSDAERAEVGTMYKQVGKTEALELGLRFVGPKLENFAKDARALAPEGKLTVHCWRGGQRSGSMAWLFRQAGLEVEVLQGGYKAYRHYVLESLQTSPFKLVVLGGETGSGKTKILHCLRDLGEQIIDLEGLANHKGSAFGFIGELPQPTVEQFENNLFEAMHPFNPATRVWVENESHSIGRIYIPEGFWQKMRTAPLVNIKIPQAVRINNLLDDYVLTDPDDLEKAFLKIAKKLGGLQLKTALESLQNNNFTEAAHIALQYYDKTYQHGLDHSLSTDIQQLTFDHGSPLEIARELVKSTHS